jgi:hypothetical protein
MIYMQIHLVFPLHHNPNGFFLFSLRERGEREPIKFNNRAHLKTFEHVDLNAFLQFSLFPAIKNHGKKERENYTSQTHDG